MTDINKLEELAKAATQDWTMARSMVRINHHKYSGVDLYAHTKENTDYLYAVRPSEILSLISKYRRMEEALKWYGSPLSYVETQRYGARTPVQADGGARARQALQDE